MSKPRYATIEDAQAHGSICGGCQITGAESVLSICAGCKSAHYCSRDCQRKAWVYHKALCKTFGPDPYVRQLESSLGLDIELFDKWKKHHGPIFSWACFNAFDLRCHPQRGKTHILFIILEANSAKRRRGKNARKTNAFKVVETIFMDRATLQEYCPRAWDLLKLYEIEHAKREDKRVFSPKFFSYGPLLRLQYDLWFDRELLTMKEDANWKAVLQSVTDGKDEYEVVQGNPVHKY